MVEAKSRQSKRELEDHQAGVNTYLTKEAKSDDGKESIHPATDFSNTNKRKKDFRNSS